MRKKLIWCARGGRRCGSAGCARVERTALVDDATGERETYVATRAREVGITFPFLFSSRDGEGVAADERVGSGVVRGVGGAGAIEGHTGLELIVFC